MYISSHRVRAEERRLVKRLVYTILMLVVITVFFVTAGLPMVVKAVLFLSGIGKTDKTVNTETADAVIFPPVLDPLPEATNSAKIRLYGIAEKNSEVVIYVNGGEQGKTDTDGDGKFKSPQLKLKEGKNEITASVIIKDKESSPSEKLYITLLQGEPKLEIENPQDGERVTADNSSYTIRGETDPENRVSINGRFAIVDNSGKFQFKVSLTKGDNAYHITASDPAGNTTETDKTINYDP